MGSWDILKEMLPRPDASGIRAAGVLRKPMSRASDYPYDEEIGEAIGTPMNFSISSSPDSGETVPGTSGWARNPPKEWDPEPPAIESPLNSIVPYFRDETDDELENKLDRYWGDDRSLGPEMDPGSDLQSLILTIIDSELFPATAGGSMKSSKDSAWDILAREQKILDQD